MGCDIHTYLEVKNHDGKYVMVSPITGHAKDRNYYRFSILAGVRGGYGKLGLPERAAKGMPIDVSDSVKYHYDMWSGDAHSASYDTLEDFLLICYMTDFHLMRGFNNDIVMADVAHFAYGTGYKGYKPSMLRDYIGTYIYDDFEYEYEALNAIHKYRVVYWFDN